MLLTTSIDSDLKVFVIQLQLIKDKVAIDFDKNENDPFQLQSLRDNLAIAAIKNSK